MAVQVSAATMPRIDVARYTTGEQPVTDAQGRVYYPRFDEATGHLLLEHHSSGRTPDGGRVDLAITIDFAPDQSFTRTVEQQLHAANGDIRAEQSVAGFSADGIQRSQVVTARAQSANQATSELTRSEFANGTEVARITDVQATQRAVQASGDRVEASTTVHAEWRDGGRPITQATVPVIDRRERDVFTTPDGGINRGTDRVVTTNLRSTGPINALTYPEPMQVVVRFNGRAEQYIERELSVPVDSTGTPHYDQATTIRNEDHQSLVTKAATQARVWGGFVGSWMGVLGVRLLPSMRGPGNVLMYAGVGASAAGVAGEVHALATQRHDASVGRLAMELYDTTWLGLLVASRRNGAARTLTTVNAQRALAVGGIAQGARLISDLAGNGPLRGSTSMPALDHVADTLTHVPNRAQSPDWRLEPRFDPTSVVLTNL